MNSSMNTFVVDLLVDAVRRQSWYRSKANTIHAGIALVGSVLAFVATMEFANDPRWAGGLALAIQFIGVVAVKLTRNGFQVSQAAELSAAANDHGAPALPDAVWSDLVTVDTGRHRLIEG